MISIDNPKNYHKFYDNSLVTTQRKFLEKKDHRGFSNPSQTKKDIITKMFKSFRDVNYILDNRKNLNKEDVYSIFNATFLQNFFRNLLSKSTTDEEPFINMEYDFRTSEIARLMFEASTKYLLQSVNFENDPYVKENIRHISNNFKTLSETLLKNEKDDGTISDEEKWKTQSKIWKMMDEFPDLVPNEMFFEESERHQDVAKAMAHSIIRLDAQYKYYSKKKNRLKMKEIKEEQEGLIDAFAIMEEHNKRWYDQQEEIRQLEGKFNDTYNHISAFFSRLDVLKETPRLPKNIDLYRFEKNEFVSVQKSKR